MYPKQIVKLSAKICEDKKALEILILDLKESSVSDYFVICTVGSETQARAISDEIERELRKKKVPIGHVEGYSVGKWILLDAFSVVVHIFTSDMRKFYALEEFWSKAPIVKLDS